MKAPANAPAGVFFCTSCNVLFRRLTSCASSITNQIMKKLLLALLLAVSCPMLAQTSVTGKVTDKKSGAALPYVSVTVKEDSKIITGGMTDDSGNFEIKNLQAKPYRIEIQFMGYKTFATDADLSTDAKRTLGTIALEEEATQIEGIIVERTTIEQKIDRKVITVGRDLTTSGATASEIMNNIPSVNVDQDGKISLRGNENVRVLVDGRPTNIDPAQLLKQIPSTSLKKIELITNPSAKYNPEGMSGIINIVLHKSANDGFNASVNSGLTFGEKPKINNSMNMNYRRGKVNFFGTYGNNFGKYFNDGDIRRTRDEIRQTLDIVNDDRSHLFKAGMDFYIDDRNTISAYTNQNYSAGDGTIDLDMTGPTAPLNMSQRAHYDSDSQNGAYNFAYKHLGKTEGETLDFEVNYNYYKEHQFADFRNSYLDPSIVDDGYNDRLTDRRKNTTANLDYVKPIGEKSTLELGAESRIIRTESDYLSNNANFPNALYNYDLDIYSAYATFGQKFEKWSYQLGARFESYKVDATLNGESAYKDDYITVYPSGSLVYNPSDKNQFQLSYSRRVDRPSIEQTKPVREFATPLVTSVGNPELDPMFTNSAEFNYTRTTKIGTITTGVYLRNIQQEISRILYPDPEDPELSQILTFDNYKDNTAYGFEASANLNITKWWDMQPAVDFSNIRQRGVVGIVDDAGETEFVEKLVNVAAFNGRLNNNFKATKALRFLLFGFYRSGVDRVQNYSKAMYKIDMGGRYSFLSDKASVSVRLNDVFNNMAFRFRGDVPTPTRGMFGWESRTLYIGFNYMFGAGKNRELQRKQRENDTNQGGGGMF